MKTVYYFGCVGSAGHFLHTPGPLSVGLGQEILPKSLWPKVDTSFCPQDGQGQGLIKYTQLDGWSIIAFWDRSGDSRPGSHSTFLINESVTPEDLLEAAKLAYPQIFSRYSFEIVLAH